MTMMKKIFRTEESLIWSMIILADIVMFLAANLYDLYVSAGLVVLGAMFMGAVYLILLRYPKKTADPHSRDERSSHCSLLATRNAFIFTLLAIAILAGISDSGANYSSRDLLKALGWIITGSIFVYLPSYLYYKDIAVGA
jgi:uncharacterized membrane protein